MFFKKKKSKNLTAGVGLNRRQIKVAGGWGDKSGFTLMEVLVSMSIFVIVSLASLSIYAATLKASQRTTALTRVQQEAQLIMSVLAKKIRTSRVDYSYYPGGEVSNPAAALALTDASNDNYVFSFDSGNSTLTVSANGGEAKAIPATYVQITDLKFYINPTTNPFISLDEPPSSQPYVTLVMTVSSKKGAQTANLTLQQSVPQRSGGVAE